ncbi:hypothetical protein TNIN_46751 [Trichonephila inaurata madagascariensis]|uniref:Uncharacterized protein n=1 Tax=Trichonephila inaurata madagascariensis TaxID=2747483 RepID=A0A8X7C307_9ARAC|nr:hypothetical protein TNIN_46751 [Trichonephila inaurata madagascariensis]
MDVTAKCFISSEQGETNNFSHNQPSLHMRQKKSFKKWDKTFTEIDKVKSDVLIHSGLKFQKDQTKRNKLKKHLCTHSNDRLGECEICKCDKNFTESDRVNADVLNNCRLDFHSGQNTWQV